MKYLEQYHGIDHSEGTKSKVRGQGAKARHVMRGFQDKEKPHSDSPTIANESL